MASCAAVVVIENIAAGGGGDGVAKRVGDRPGVLGERRRPAHPFAGENIEDGGDLGTERAAVQGMLHLRLEGMAVADEHGARPQFRHVADDMRAVPSGRDCG